MSPVNTAQSIVSYWLRLGVELPKPFVEAAAEFKRFNNVLAPPPTDTKAAGDPAEVIAEMARELVAAERFPQAKDQILSKLAGTVLDEAGKAVEAIYDAMRPVFDKAAADYAAAVAQLPVDLTSEALINAGQSTIDAHRDAQGAAAQLGWVDAWLATLQKLPVYVSCDNHPILRLLAPETGSQIQDLTRITHTVHIDMALQRLNPVWFAAAKAGIEFEMNTPAAADRLYEKISNTEHQQGVDAGLNHSRGWAS